jgi:pimeloyl-ACP methyl ester carboxylesterase
MTNLLNHDIDGYQLAYLHSGAGTPLLLVHGSMSDYRSWALQMEAFPGYSVHAVSLRHCYPERWNGHGDGFSIARHAHDLAAFILGVLGGSAHVVGHSRGGAVVLQLALDQPALVRSLVLADPGGLDALLPDTEDGRRMASEGSRMFDRLRDDLATGNVDEAARRFVEALSGPGAWERRTLQQRQVLLDNITTGPACADRPSFPQGALAALQPPTLLVTGERSPRRYALMLAALQSCCPQARDLITVPDAAHAMQRDNAHAFNDAVAVFLSTAV